MTFDPRLERALPSLLADLEPGGQPDYTDSLLARTARVRQRPAWTFPERWLPMDTIANRLAAPPVRWRLIALVALLVVALVAAAIVAVSGTRPRLPMPFGPANNGAIAYMSKGDLFRWDPVTHATQPLVLGSTYDFRPGYSPDGSMIAFWRREFAGAPCSLMVANADGTGVRVVTASPLTSEPPGWNWSPDGRSIAFVTTEGAYMIYDLRAGGAPRVADTGGVLVGTPIFQPPTGARVLFRGQTGLRIGLYVMNADGTDIRAIIEPYPAPASGEDLLEPNWSPDGQRIVYQQVSASGDTMHLFIMNADGSGAQPIGGTTEGDVWDGYGRFSPDGTRVLFARAPGGATAAKYSWGIIALADDRFTPVGPVLGATVGSGMHWSPDGTRIIAVFNPDALLKPALIDPATGAMEELPWDAETADWQSAP